MAISQMQELSLLLPKELLDEILSYLQNLQSVEIQDLQTKETWKGAFEKELVWNPDTSFSEHLQALTRRQEKLARMIENLQAFVPKKKMLEALKEAPLETSFVSLEQMGQARDEEAFLAAIQQQFQVLARAQEVKETAQSEVAELEKWVSLDVTPVALKQFKHLRAFVGTIPTSGNNQFNIRLQDYPNLEVQEVFTSSTEKGILVLCKAEVAKETQAVLTELGFKLFEYAFEELPKERLVALQATIKEQEALITSTKIQLASSNEELKQLKCQLDYVLNLTSRQESKEALASTQNLVALEGWIEQEQIEDLRMGLTQQFGGAVLLQIHEVTAADRQRVPTKLKNNALIEPFELVTEMYSLPKYEDKDPTPVVSLFYFIFFGMMAADIGYGLLLFGGTSWALKALHIKPNLAKNLRFFRILGVGVALWGVIYGSFFGFKLPFAIVDTSTDVITILIMSVVIGFITVMTGLYLSGTKNIRMKDYAEAYNSGFAWMLILVGLALLAAGRLFPSLAIAGLIGQWLAIINAVGIVLVSIISAKSLKGLGPALFNLYNISSYVGDLVSFTRLMALGLAGASIGSAFNLIVSLFPPFARFSIGIVLFIALHSINMFLSFLSGYVHGARLIFVEFFGKFYDGGGKAFKPLKPAGKYVRYKK
ncbi:ATP synthase subunit I [Streptococcus anginosus 1_2_62CV]|uniref:V-type ATP synthase subunit I n=1 Tax=Streptococcus anginosus TaxID=1328 RepID=UPI0001F60E6E|nr:V-type ATP synthase subunit I [Streptococcus anginosus]EFW06790.1 ATP synthase subunit I [Streptococcus anginosus 1_2_62CV]MCW1065961.1 V-type ATP synthase subunit I [Streptococcus anginosus]